VGTEVREKAEEWGVQILSDEWSQYGQGEPLTSTPTVTPWHLSRAAGKYRKGLRKYLEDLLEKERQGSLTKKSKEDLEKNRHWAFLRRLIGEEVLERFGGVLRGNGAGGLAGALAPHLGMTTDEAERQLESLVREGNIFLKRNERGDLRWEWSPNKTAPLSVHDSHG
jgi:hypothetical protein